MASDNLTPAQRTMRARANAPLSSWARTEDRAAPSAAAADMPETGHIDPAGRRRSSLRALLAIDPAAPSPMRSRAMNCDASYVTAMVNDLERAGYAERHPAGPALRFRPHTSYRYARPTLATVNRCLYLTFG